MREVMTDIMASKKMASKKMKNDFRPVTKIFLAHPGGHGEPFCGPGMIKLIKYIKETGNVRKACEDMQVSYSKGWKLLRTLDGCLQYQVVARQQGGKGGGKAHLTEEGEKFLENHEAFEAACCEAVNKLFDQHYPGDYGHADDRLP
ncbi:MAG: LysR family transcriptional regulator [Spirochaetaceae bacterium]|jgi:molybdate transport system regulatory protein|nr:LysR family transcriptional regulator [Spirochaetaceae bacterium]